MGIAIGLEQMGKQGLLGAANKARKDEKVFEADGRYGGVMSTEGVLGTGLMPGVFAQAGMEYAYENDGVGFEQFAKVAQKNHAHSVLNPLAQYQKEFSLDEVMAAEMISYPNTLVMCCPTGDGAAAAVLVTGEKLRTLSKEQQRRAVKISASVLTTDPWTPNAQVQPDVNTLTRNAASAAYEQAGVSPQDLDLVELHDCFATAELIHYDNLQLCERGGAGEWIDKRGPWRDGEIPVNVSGGLLSKGHPLGATGIANIFEVTTHLRGEAGDRQIEGATVGLTHVIGLGSACAVHILEKSSL
jgi:acetyl-CoA acetyltransferase